MTILTYTVTVQDLGEAASPNQRYTVVATLKGNTDGAPIAETYRSRATDALEATVIFRDLVERGAPETPRRVGDRWWKGVQFPA